MGDGLATSCVQFFQGQLDLDSCKLLGKGAREICCIVLGVVIGHDPRVGGSAGVLVG